MTETQPKKRVGRPPGAKAKISNGQSNITLLASSSSLSSNPQTSSRAALQWDLDDLENLHPTTCFEVKCEINKFLLNQFFFRMQKLQLKLNQTNLMKLMKKKTPVKRVNMNQLI